MKEYDRYPALPVGVLLLYALCPVVGVIALGAGLPDMPEARFRLVVIVAVVAYALCFGPWVESALRSIIQRVAWLKALHAKRQDTLRDIAIMATPASTVLLEPGLATGHALGLVAVLSLGLAVVLIVHNECELLWARWRKRS